MWSYVKSLINWNLTVTYSLFEIITCNFHLQAYRPRLAFATCLYA